MGFGVYLAAQVGGWVRGLGFAVVLDGGAEAACPTVRGAGGTETCCRRLSCWQWAPAYKYVFIKNIPSPLVSTALPTPHSSTPWLGPTASSSVSYSTFLILRSTPELAPSLRSVTERAVVDNAAGSGPPLKKYIS